MDVEKEQYVLWKAPIAPSFHANGLHSKVNRTYSIGGACLPPAALPHQLCRDMPINFRSSPDGSAGEADSGGHRPIGGKQIDEQSFSTTDVKLRDNGKTNANGHGSLAPQPVDCSVEEAARSRSPMDASQPNLGQKKSTFYSFGMADPKSGESHGPVASDSRDELLQCESGGSFALEDVLRHYWLLSDRDDDHSKMKEPVNGQFDWNSVRSSLNSTYRFQTNIDTPEVMWQLDRDDDGDSVVTLSTISEEDSEDLSSAAESQNMNRLFGNGRLHFHSTENKVMYDFTDYINDIRTDKETVNIDDTYLQNSLTNLITNETPSKEFRSSRAALVDGLDSEEDDATPTPSMVGSFVRRFSDYVSDIYPFSSAFVSHASNVSVEEGDSCVTLEPFSTSDSRRNYNEYTVTDTLVHLKFIPAQTDRLEAESNSHQPRTEDEVNSGDCNSENRLSDSDGYGNINEGRSTITSPTSWYTVSDVFDSQSFETASEQAEDDEFGEVSCNTAYAKSTAVARCLSGTENTSSSSVTVTATGSDSITAIAEAAARAASLSASAAVKNCPMAEQHTGDIEVIVTTSCVMSRRQQSSESMNSSSCEELQLLPRTVAAVETKTSVKDVAIQSSDQSSCFECEDGFSDTISKVDMKNKFRLSLVNSSPQLKNGNSEEEIVEEVMSAADEATRSKFSCHIAIPCTILDGYLRPHADEGPYLPTAIGQGFSKDDHPDCEVTGVAVKDVPRKHKDTSQDGMESNINGISESGTWQHLRRFLNESAEFSSTKESTVKASRKRDGVEEKYLWKEVENSFSIRQFGKQRSGTSPNSTPEKLIGEENHAQMRKEFLDDEAIEVPVEITVEMANLDEKPLKKVTKEDLDKPLSEMINTANGQLHLQYPATELDRGNESSGQSERASSAQRFLGHDEKRSVGLSTGLRSQSLLLETDIDTLEHHRTPVSRNTSHLSVQEMKSCSSPIAARRKSSTVSWNEPILNKEVLEEMLSDSTSAEYFTEKRLSLGSTPSEHYASEPSLQNNPFKMAVSSSSKNPNGKRNTGSVNVIDKLSIGTQARILHSKDTLSNENHVSTSHHSKHNVGSIEHYEQSPSLRRRSLDITHTSQQSDTETETVHRKHHSKMPRPHSDNCPIRRHSSSPASSSFENLVDSLLGITGVMSMEAAFSQSKTSFSMKSLDRKADGSQGPASVSDDSEANRPNQKALANKSPPTNRLDQGIVSLSEPFASATPNVHPTTPVRKHVHFRKAKHIFRKCHFCIDAGERKGNASPIRKVVHHENQKGSTKSH